MLQALKKRYWRFLNSLSRWTANAIWSRIPSQITRSLDTLTVQRWEEKAARSSNPLLRFGAKYYSQNDEDGILLQVLSRVGIATGYFIEIGVGKGLENNTAILLMHGWRGAWVDAEDLAFSTAGASRLRFLKQFVEPRNVAALVNQLFPDGEVSPSDLDVLSVDIDSCDRTIVSELLRAGCSPKVLIVEYNAKFPPPIVFSVDTPERWDGTDYFGCSLQGWWELLVPAGYKLVACNVTGLNAFFVRNQFEKSFLDVPTDIRQLYMPPEYTWFQRAGHLPSPKTIAKFV